MSTAPRVFISYSHDSDELKQSVLGLANRLRDGGVDAWLDQYVPAPPEGWPRWMDAEIKKADYVLLVCTETYLRRVSMDEEPGKGHGVLWESHLICQHIFNAGTVNSKFIPVLPSGGKSAHVPTPLGSVQRYYPFLDAGYEELYRRLTGQPAIQVPALGKLIVMPPAAAPLPSAAAIPVAQPEPSAPAPAASVRCVNSQLGLIATEEGIAYIPVRESHWDGREATMLFEPDEAADGPFLDTLRNRHRIRLAYRNNAAVCSAQTVKQQSKDGADQWQINFRLEKTEFQPSMEVQMSGLTPDKAAVLRAERLLLNQHLPGAETQNMNAIMREIMLKGQDAELEIGRSPFPDLFREFGDRPQLFVDVAWVSAMLQLKMSGTVEQVSALELTLSGSSLKVTFAGRRRKIYSNMPAAEVKVAGICPL